MDFYRRRHVAAIGMKQKYIILLENINDIYYSFKHSVGCHFNIARDSRVRLRLASLKLLWENITAIFFEIMILLLLALKLLKWGNPRIFINHTVDILKQHTSTQSISTISIIQLFSSEKWPDTTGTWKDRLMTAPRYARTSCKLTVAVTTSTSDNENWDPYMTSIESIQR